MSWHEQQSLIRGYLARRGLRRDILNEFDSVLGAKDATTDGGVVKSDSSQTAPDTKPDAIIVFKLIRQFLFIYDRKRDSQRFDMMCRHILESMLSSTDVSSTKSYVSVCYSKNYLMQWITQLKKILQICSSCLKHLNPDSGPDHKSMVLYLNMILILTNSNIWKISDNLRTTMNQLCVNSVSQLVSKGLYVSLQVLLQKGLCRLRPCLKKTDISAIITISMRPVINSSFNETHINLFLIHILSIPALIYHLEIVAPDMFNLMAVDNCTMLSEVIKFLNCDQNSRILFNVLEGNYGLCLLANLINLSYKELDAVRQQILPFVVSVMFVA